MTTTSFFDVTDESSKHGSTHAVRDFDKKTRQKETLKTPKKLVIFASNRSTHSTFHNESRANRIF